MASVDLHQGRELSEVKLLTIIMIKVQLPIFGIVTLVIEDKLWPGAVDGGRDGADNSQTLLQRLLIPLG